MYRLIINNLTAKAKNINSKETQKQMDLKYVHIKSKIKIIQYTCKISVTGQMWPGSWKKHKLETFQLKCLRRMLTVRWL